MRYCLILLNISLLQAIWLMPSLLPKTMSCFLQQQARGRKQPKQRQLFLSFFFCVTYLYYSLQKATPSKYFTQHRMLYIFSKISQDENTTATSRGKVVSRIQIQYEVCFHFSFAPSIFSYDFEQRYSYENFEFFFSVICVTDFFLLQISSLVNQNLLTHHGGGDGMVKLQCNADYNFVSKIAAMVGFDLRKYLSVVDGQTQ